MEWYCDFAIGDVIHGPYHDREYGFPIEDETELFERLLLEINQAGLNWALILKKREGFRAVYDGFDVDKVADYGEEDRTRLLADARIIRNKLKVNAAIVNAQIIREMRDSYGGFARWLHEITGEFLMSIGYLPSPHRESCPVYQEIALLNPPWMETE